MGVISEALEQEILQRVESEHWDSAEDLVRAALASFESREVVDMDWLNQELLKALDSEDIEMTPEEWARLDREIEAESDTAHAA